MIFSKSLIPAFVAFNLQKYDFVVFAITRAIVVFPTPGGQYKIIEPKRSAFIAR